MNNMGHVKAFFNFSCSEATMLKRLTARGKSDDNTEAFKERYAAFKKQTAPLNDYFQKQGKLVEIKAERSIEVVTRQVLLEVQEKIFGQRIVPPRVVFVVGGPGAGKV